MELLENLIQVSKVLQYVGTFLLTNSVQGHDATKHVDAISLITEQFKGVQAQIESHPDFADKVAQAQAAQAAQTSAEELK